MTIKFRFRAWDNFDKVMRDVTLLDYNQDFIGYSYPVFMKHTMHMELMLATGMVDKNDQEIFEGDIIFWAYWEEFEVKDSGRAKVIFDKGMFKLLDVRTEKEVWDNLFDCIENCNVYIQGNIYENPELLKNKEE